VKPGVQKAANQLLVAMTAWLIVFEVLERILHAFDTPGVFLLMVLATFAMLIWFIVRFIRLSSQ
jgi:hypothetical protein